MKCCFPFKAFLQRLSDAMNSEKYRTPLSVLSQGRVDYISPRRAIGDSSAVAWTTYSALKALLATNIHNESNPFTAANVEDLSFALRSQTPVVLFCFDQFP